MSSTNSTAAPIAPAMVLPEELHAIIDLRILADINRFLSDSELEDDLTLSEWIKQQYLYEPLQEQGRFVQTTEAFANLLRAHTRVKSLTNKAQDKWPFFDSNFRREMRPALVKNNARGESAPGVSLPGLKLVEDSVIDTDRQSTIPAPTSPAKSSSVASSTIKQTRRTSPGQQKREVSLAPSAASSSLRAASLVGASQNIPAAQAEPTVLDAQSTVDPPNSADKSVEEAVIPNQFLSEKVSQSSRSSSHDSEMGRVRGSKGRSVGKSKSPDNVKLEPGLGAYSTRNKRTSQELETTPALVVEGESMTPSRSTKPANKSTVADVEIGHDGDSMEVDVVSTREQSAMPKSGATSDRAISEESGESLVNSRTSKYSSPTYKMAVEYEPVTTNLDKYPPGSRKRKSESATQSNSPRKRARSSQMQRSARDIDDSTAKASSEPVASKLEDEEPMMVTRRSKRQSTRMSVSPPQSERATPAETNKRNARNPREAGDQEIIDKPTTSTTLPKTSTLKQTPQTAASAVPKPHGEVAQQGAPKATPSATTASAKEASTSSSNIPGKRMQISNNDDIDVNGPQKSRKRAATPLDDDHLSDDGDKEIRVDYFARVQLRRKVVEIPLMTKNLNKEAKVIEDYADFVQEHDADSISFGLYKGLLEDHGKKGRGKGKKK